MNHSPAPVLPDRVYPPRFGLNSFRPAARLYWQPAEYLHHTHCPPWQVLRLTARRRVSSCPEVWNQTISKREAERVATLSPQPSAQKPRIRAWVNPKATEVRGILLLLRGIENLVDSFASCWRLSPVEALVPRSPFVPVLSIFAMRRISDGLTGFHRRESSKSQSSPPFIPQINSNRFSILCSSLLCLWPSNALWVTPSSWFPHLPTG